LKNQPTEYRTMTQKRVSKGTKEIQAMMAEGVDFLRPLVRSVIQEFLEAEMTATIGAEKGERVEGRLSYRSGYYPRSLVTRVGKLELRVPQDRNGGVFHRDFRALSAQREGAGDGAHRDVRPRSIDPES
jgi:transposase-like protein